MHAHHIDLKSTAWGLKGLNLSPATWFHKPYACIQKCQGLKKAVCICHFKSDLFFFVLLFISYFHMFPRHNFSFCLVIKMFDIRCMTTKQLDIVSSIFGKFQKLPVFISFFFSYRIFMFPDLIFLSVQQIKCSTFVAQFDIVSFQKRSAFISFFFSYCILIKIGYCVIKIWLT